MFKFVIDEVNVERDNDEKSFEETSKLRFRGRVRGNHRFAPRTSEKMKIGSEDVEEEDRSLSLTTGSRRQLKIHSQEENEIDTEDIKSFKLSHSQNHFTFSLLEIFKASYVLVKAVLTSFYSISWCPSYN